MGFVCLDLSVCPDSPNSKAELKELNTFFWGAGFPLNQSSQAFLNNSIAKMELTHYILQVFAIR